MNHFHRLRSLRGLFGRNHGVVGAVFVQAPWQPPGRLRADVAEVVVFKVVANDGIRVLVAGNRTYRRGKLQVVHLPVVFPVAYPAELNPNLGLVVGRHLAKHFLVRKVYTVGAHTYIRGSRGIKFGILGKKRQLDVGFARTVNGNARAGQGNIVRIVFAVGIRVEVKITVGNRGCAETRDTALVTGGGVGRPGPILGAWVCAAVDPVGGSGCLVGKIFRPEWLCQHRFHTREEQYGQSQTFDGNVFKHKKAALVNSQNRIERMPKVQKTIGSSTVYSCIFFQKGKNAQLNTF